MTIWKTEAGRYAVEALYGAILAHWPAPNSQFTVPTREGETFVIASGREDAPPLVLLHGSASNSFMWMGDVASWAAHFRVYAIDIIGEPGLSAPSRPTLASGAYPLWLDDVLSALHITRTVMIGLSLGGYLALDYASKHAHRIRALAVLCPGGVGRHRNVPLWAAPLLLLGPWGRRKLSALIRGPKPANAPPSNPAIAEFLAMIYANFHVRRERLPLITDSALRHLTMPVLAILGGKDVMIDSAGTRRRIATNIPHAQIRWLPDTGHVIVGQTAPILDFLLSAAR